MLSNYIKNCSVVLGTVLLLIWNLFWSLLWVDEGQGHVLHLCWIKNWLSWRDLKTKVLSSLKLWMDQAIFFGIVSFFFNYVPEVGKLPSCWWFGASCAIVWRMNPASCWFRYYHCHHHSHASDPTRWAIGITCHNVGRFSAMNGASMGLLQLWMQFVSHQCQSEQWMPQVVKGNNGTIGRGPSTAASHVTGAHLFGALWTGPWWQF